jgi:adenylate kinase
LLTKPPKQAGVCDNCGGKLVARADDDEATVKVRYETYLQQTMPAIEYYKNLDVLAEIDASASADEIYEELKSTISEVAK